MEKGKIYNVKLEAVVVGIDEKAARERMFEFLDYCGITGKIKIREIKLLDVIPEECQIQ